MRTSPNELSVDAVRDQLDRIDWKSAEAMSILDELQSFGQVLFDEVQQRAGQLDSKLTNVLNWTAGILAVVLIGNDSWTHPRGRLDETALYAVLLAIVTAIVALLFSYGGLRVRAGWHTPSEKDWLLQNVLNDPDAIRNHASEPLQLLKKLHVLSLLKAHQSHAALIGQKADNAKTAERTMVAAAMLLGIAGGLKLCAGLIQLWFPTCGPS